MDINEMCEKISDRLCSAEEGIIWIDILQYTDPGHYGVEDIEVDVLSKNIWVNVPKKIFNFKNANVSFSARLGASRDGHGFDKRFTKTVSGQGTFDFSPGSKDILIHEFSINDPIKLYEEE